MDILEKARFIVSDQESLLLITQAWQYMSSMWESDEGVCPHCLGKLIIVKDKYIGHEDWCWYLRAQNWLLSNGEKIPEICE